MIHLPPIIQDLAAILGVAAIVTLIFKLIKQPVVLGYIVAGIIVGPFTPPVVSVVDEASIKVWAELGVIFLMFSLGLEFSFRRLAKVGVSAAFTAVFQIAIMIFMGFVVGRLLHWSVMNSIFLGCMISISSTTIIIKSFEELGLKSKRFAELVFGILIVEDLAAIVMLVALGNIATQDSVSGLDLLLTAGKMAFVVGAWLVIGIFLVPRFVRLVGRKGNDEMLVVVSLGLCLGLVSVAAYFEYSVALGAFIMGSILAETRESQRIEHLVSPLKDIFGAVFFVSVGMLLDPSILIENLSSVLIVCAVIIAGKVITVVLGTLLTGQTLATSVYTGLSMAQIGEFSFIIATLGLSYKVIDPKLYPIIVAASLLTTFTTPYFLKSAPFVLKVIEASIPARAKTILERYSTWFQRPYANSPLGQNFYGELARWGINGIVVVTIFVLSAAKLVPWVTNLLDQHPFVPTGLWLVTFVIASPFIWAMINAFKGSSIQPRKGKIPNLGDMGLLLSRVGTVLMVGLLSAEFFAVWVTVMVTVSVTIIVFVVFRKQLEGYYRWFEMTFVSGIDPNDNSEKKGLSVSHAHLVPWDARLTEITIGPISKLVGKSLADLQLRERFGLNVVVIRRVDEDLVAPKAEEIVLPADVFLCFGTDDDLETFESEALQPRQSRRLSGDPAAYTLRQIGIQTNSSMVGRSIRQSGIREQYDCMVVGVERNGQRFQSPKSDFILASGDLLWIVGAINRLHEVQRAFSPEIIDKTEAKLV